MSAAVVQTLQGRLRGGRGDGVHVFKGVPFAAPPSGPGQFRSPQPVAAWTGVRDASAFGARPIQLEIPPQIAAMVPDPSPTGDDCLALNVWTPAVGEARMPVMVWIPGGAFEVGSGASYDGSRFARDGVVCVTINYRVGAQGFLYFGPGEANYGLQDQIAALVWVRDNIAAFGGDPDNVTIFGQSAGAMSIGSLLAMPSARGLFRRAILESGGTQTVMSATTADKNTRALAAKVGISPTRDAFASISADRILKAQIALKADILARPDPELWGAEVVATSMPFHPVIDGQLIADHPLRCVTAGASAHVDVLAGWNKDDWKLFVVADGLLGAIDDATLTGAVEQHGFKSLKAYGLDGARALAAYHRSFPAASPSEVLACVQTDYWCRIPALRLADARNKADAATFLYEFTWPSPMASGVMGACHALEIPFVFDTLDKGAGQMLGPLLGTNPPQALADAMHRAWISFATSGDPGWPRYEIRRPILMRFDAVPTLKEVERTLEREVWSGIR